MVVNYIPIIGPKDDDMNKMVLATGVLVSGVFFGCGGGGSSPETASASSEAAVNSSSVAFSSSEASSASSEAAVNSSSVAFPSSEASSTSSEIAASSTAASSSEAGENIVYYGVTMYEEPDSSFSYLATYQGFNFYERQDEYWEVMALTHPDYGGGVLKLVLSKTFYSDEYGTQAKSAYNEFKPSLDEKYELVESFDFCNGSSYVCQADNYAYAIYREERYLLSFYNSGDDSIVIQLDGSTGSIYNIDLKIIYETKGFADAIAAQEDDAGADLAPPLYSKMLSGVMTK